VPVRDTQTNSAENNSPPGLQSGQQTMLLRLHLARDAMQPNNKGFYAKCFALSDRMNRSDKVANAEANNSNWQIRFHWKVVVRSLRVWHSLK